MVVFNKLMQKKISKKFVGADNKSGLTLNFLKVAKSDLRLSKSRMK